MTDNPLSEAASSCSTNGELKPDSTVCAQYYVCKNQQWNAMVCATDYYFDATKLVCMPRQTATPATGCNRCQWAKSQFVNAVDNSNCANYYYCNSNGIGSLLQCPSQTYFNEQLQGCTGDATLSTYAANNGACKGATAGTATTNGPNTTDDDEKTTEKTTEKPADDGTGEDGTGEDGTGEDAGAGR